MADKRAYFKVDVGYLSNPKVATLVEDNPRAVLLHLQCIAYATQHATNGVVPMRLAMRQACAEQCDLDLLMHCGLLVQLDERNVEVHDYLEHQRSAEEVKSASDKGKRAAEARWGKPKDDASSNASSMPNPMPRKKERENLKDLSAERGRFDEFWAIYPKRGKHSNPKEPARQKWNELVKTIDPEVIIASARVLAKLREGEDPQTNPQAITWLRQKRFLDDVPATDATPARHLQAVGPTRDAQLAYEQKQAIAPPAESLPW